jgi:serine/threonine-protein kinase
MKAGQRSEILEAFVVGDRGFERRVAIKRLRADVAHDEASLDAYLDEARLMSRLHHANIIGVYDFGFMDQLPFQVIEHVDGLDLSELIHLASQEQASMPVELALHVAVNVAHALEHAHSMVDASGEPLSIVHRDVTPENILISWAGDVKLADFGIALMKDRRSRTRVGVAKGKSPYMAPEQMLGGGDVDHRADIFALGCVLHAMLAKRSPIEDDEARRKVMAGGECNIEPTIVDDVRAIIVRATRSERSQRYPTSEAMAGECGAALAWRIARDPRTILREWIAPFKPKEVKGKRNLVSRMMDLELILDVSSDMRRFTKKEATAVVAQSDLEDPTDADATPPEATPLPESTWPSEGVTSIRASYDGPVASAPQPDPLLGVVVHGLRLEEVIGIGSLSRVYRAVHMVLGKECALKVLQGTAANDERAIKRLHREAQILSRMNHPNVVRVLDCGTTPGGAPFLAMELLRGTTLKALLRMAGRLTPERTAQIARQIVLGLSEAHQNNLVHRDLKPSNVMLVGPSGRELIKVLDFGIARNLDAGDGTRLTASNLLMGTPRFMAPEQIRGAKHVGPTADLYSLGVIMYSMLAGTTPFVGTPADVIHAQLHDAPVPLEPAGGLEAIVHRLLEKDPERRFESGPLLLEAIDRLGLNVLPYAASDTATSLTRATEISTERRVQPTRTMPAAAHRKRSLVAPAMILVVAVLAIAAALLIATTSNPLEDEVVSAKVVELPAAPSAVAREERSDPETRSAPSDRPAADGPVATKIARKAPVHVDRRTIEDMNKVIRTELERRGLTPADLETDDAVDPLSSAYGAFRVSMANKDREAAKEQFDAVMSSLSRVEISKAMLDRKLTRIGRALSKASSVLPRETYVGLESRYLDARTEASAHLSNARAEDLARQIDTIERDVHAALGR